MQPTLCPIIFSLSLNPLIHSKLLPLVHQVPCVYFFIVIFVISRATPPLFLYPNTVFPNFIQESICESLMPTTPCLSLLLEALEVCITV